MESRYVDLKDGHGTTVRGSFVLCTSDFTWILGQSPENCRLIITPSAEGSFYVVQHDQHMHLYRRGALANEDKDGWYYVTGAVVNFQNLLLACKHWWPFDSRFDVRVEQKG